MSFKPRLVAYLCLLFVGVSLVMTECLPLAYAQQPPEQITVASDADVGIAAVRKLWELDTSESPYHGVPLRAGENAGTADAYAVNWSVPVY
jgi:hypothetical protein